MAGMIPMKSAKRTVVFDSLFNKARLSAVLTKLSSIEMLMRVLTPLLESIYSLSLASKMIWVSQPLLYHGSGLILQVALRLPPVQDTLHRLVASPAASHRDQFWGRSSSAFTHSLLKRLSRDTILVFISMRTIPNCTSHLIHPRLRMLQLNSTTASLISATGWLLIILNSMMIKLSSS